MTNLSSFGEMIRSLRKDKGLTLLSVARVLNIDTSTLCKIEKNERSASREVVMKLADVYSADIDKLFISFYSDRVAQEIWREDNLEIVLQVAEEKVKYMKSKNVEQSEIKF